MNSEVSVVDNGLNIILRSPMKSYLLLSNFSSSSDN